MGVATTLSIVQHATGGGERGRDHIISLETTAVCCSFGGIAFANHAHVHNLQAAACMTM
jgi:hypothetical protein